MSETAGIFAGDERQRQYLAEGENMALSVRRHWTMFLRAGAQSLGVLVAAFVLDSLTSDPDGAGALDPVWGFASSVAVLFFAWQVLQWWLTSLVVTDHRVFEVSGLLSRNVASMPLSKMTDITYHRSLAGRVLGYGSLLLESAGQDQALSKITHLPHPLDFYRTVTLLVTKAGAGRPRGTEDEEGVAARGVPEELFRDEHDDDDTDEIPTVPL
ncbi:MAG: PH domain-containing protein [Actinomycetota bacterium]|nr:PH domain-containing protein [Actinomycetota bacterium]